ncbi:MAG: hypothetical protein K9M81_00100 [Chthoniobacterales bacterium]|nr:hypothetical protein [Chthoniobacterales bacterium]
MVPKTWVKFIVALFLVPFVWVLTKTFLETLGFSLHHGLLDTQGCLFFLAGIVLWGLAFWLLPRAWLLWPYVYGHECTHAIWVKLFGGTVQEKFYVSTQGGHIMADRVNTWIALAPYFFPVYSLLVISIYGVATLFMEMTPFQWVMFLLLGFTWAFHLTFTCLFLFQGQPDVHYGGTFFSIIIIYGINLFLVTLFLLITAPYVSTTAFLEQFLSNLGEFIEQIQWILEKLFLAIVWLVREAHQFLAPFLK